MKRYSNSLTLLAAAVLCGTVSAETAPATLRKAYADDFLIGAALNRQVIGGRDTRAGDLSCLAGSGLRMLNAGKTPVGRLDALPPLPQLEALYLEGAPLESLEGVERFPALRTLDIRGTRVRDLSPLAGAPALEKLQIGAEQRAAAGALADAGIEITFDAG